MYSDDEPTTSDREEPQAPARVPSKPTRANNGKVGKSNYTRDELLSLFSIMEQILPIGQDEWEQVQLQHSVLYPGRDVDSIRRKYSSLHRKSVPTGHPNIPPEVRAAKLVKVKIGEKADIGGGEDENFDLEGGFSSGSGNQEPPQGRNQPPANVPAAQQPVLQPARQQSSNNGVVTVATSRVARRPPNKDANSEFIEMMKMQMMMDRQHRQEERQESRRRQEEWTVLFTSMVGGIAAAFGMELPTPPPPATTTTGTTNCGTRMNKRRRLNNQESYSSSDESSE